MGAEILMGNYNSEYEDYYNSMRRKFNRGFSGRQSKGKVKIEGNFLVRRIVRDLTGVFVLSALVLLCKAFVTPNTTAAYSYSKKVVNEYYDYKPLFEKAKDIKINDIQQEITKYLDNIKEKLTGEKTVTNKIKQDFIMPVQGTITSSFGYRTDPVTGKKEFHQGIDIDAKENTEVKACYDGKIKDCGEDTDLGKYILIDHGSGIETKYGHLNSIEVKKNDTVKVGQTIAKSGNTGKSTAPHLHLELIYMGQNENPEEYFSIKR